jgi:site-specific recombinase XerD
MVAAGGGAELAWDEFFKGQIANAHTRKNYAHDVRHFLDWCDDPDRQVPPVRIAPGDVGDYLASLQLATPTKKLRLAALRKFFDVIVARHVVLLNPAASVRAERRQVIDGNTPEISGKPARAARDSIETATLADLRDRATVAVLIYTSARVAAVARLTFKSLKHDGTQYALWSASVSEGRACREWCSAASSHSQGTGLLRSSKAANSPAQPV